VGLPGQGPVVAVPEEEAISEAYFDELTRFVEKEIYPRTAEIESDMARERESARLLNKLGILYAKYGLLEKAAAELERALALDDAYMPSLVNLGNLTYMTGELKKALEYYNRALQIKPDTPPVLLGIARFQSHLELLGKLRAGGRVLRKTERSKPGPGPEVRLPGSAGKRGGTGSRHRKRQGGDNMARIGWIGFLILPALLLTDCEPVELRNYIEQLSEPNVAVYVSETAGNDANLGDMHAPLKTIQAGIAKAASFISDGLTDSTRVNVAEGTYEVTDGTENTAEYTEGDYIDMVEGVSLYGGYAADFSRRDPEQYTSLIIDLSEEGDDPAAIRAFDGLTEATVIDGFTIQGAESTKLTSSTTPDIERASPGVSNNIIRGGYAAVGGFSLNLDIYDNSSPVIENNTIIGGDSLGNSCGIIISASSPPVITNNVITGGSAVQTNGILCWETQAGINNNTINGGTATEWSTGILNQSDDNVTRREQRGVTPITSTQTRFETTPSGTRPAGWISSCTRIT